MDKARDVTCRAAAVATAASGAPGGGGARLRASGFVFFAAAARLAPRRPPSSRPASRRACVGFSSASRPASRALSAAGSFSPGDVALRILVVLEVGLVPSAALQAEDRRGDEALQRRAAAGRAFPERPVRDFLQFLVVVPAGGALVLVNGIGVPLAGYFRITRAPSFDVTRIVSPGPNSPARMRCASGFSSCCWIARFSGRAPYTGSKPARPAGRSPPRRSRCGCRGRRAGGAGTRAGSRRCGGCARARAGGTRRCRRCG